MSKFLSLLCSLLICVATYAQEITVTIQNWRID